MHILTGPQRTDTKADETVNLLYCDSHIWINTNKWNKWKCWGYFLITTHNISEAHCSLFCYMFCCKQVPCCCVVLCCFYFLKVCETRMENWKAMGGKTDISAFLSKDTSAGFPKWFFRTICFYWPFILDFDNAPLSLLYISCCCFSICPLVRNNEVTVTILRQQTSKAANVTKLPLHC